MKRKRPELGEVIEINHRPVFSTEEGFNAVEAEVIDLLNKQFVCKFTVDGAEYTTFRFYEDKDNSWRFV